MEEATMPALLRPQLQEYRSWVVDSRRWERYRPRDGDIVITTYPKCGTTWMQRIVGMLVFATPEPRSINDDSIWIDARMLDPLDAALARLEAQPHRRFIKAHLPLDGLPLYDTVKYIHVARDGRDACMSWHNHLMAQTPEIYARFDKIGLEDPVLGGPCPRPEEDPARHFHAWITRWSDGRAFDFFAFETSFWSERQRENLLLVHYSDL
ncbi:MAG: sulfotransferase domain-containing protein, partial [Proteobacteria bacterium]|nr:sulfotransferase domain-containing protein [Pseudomonadota bacterium]